MSDATSATDDILSVLDAWRDMARGGHIEHVPAALRNEVRSQIRQDALWSPHARALTRFFIDNGQITREEVIDERDALVPGGMPPKGQAGNYIGPIAATAIAGGLTYALVELF